MSKSSRHHVVTDIARWKVESEVVGDGNQYTNEELKAYVTMLRELDDEELRSMWHGTVAEWVASRSDMPPEQDAHDSERSEMSAEWLLEQFDGICDGATPPWGYQTTFELPEL